MNNLNEKQMNAVMDVEGPVVVFAGAGSGKTRTLTYRIAHMIHNLHIESRNILAITFTNKATNEMKERLYKFYDINAKEIQISTFHSFCSKILRREIDILGYRKDFTIIDEEDQVKVIIEILKDENIDKRLAKKYQKAINYSKCRLEEPSSTTLEKIVYIYEKYEEKMKDQNLLDYEDLLIKVYELFTLYPNVLKKYQSIYKYILVDEFQDTNIIQYKIISKLAAVHKNLFIVGDDDQSIYSFRGTNYENFDLFKKDFPTYHLHTLDQNYRSSNRIVEVANNLISKNKNRQSKQLFSEQVSGYDDVIFETFSSEREEARFIIDKIKYLMSRKAKYSDFAILCRQTALMRVIEESLVRSAIPYKVYGGMSFYRRSEIKDCEAYISLLLNSDDVNSFKRVLNTPPRSLGDATLNIILDKRSKTKLSIIEAAYECEHDLPKARYKKLTEFCDLIKRYSEKIETENLVDVFNQLIEEISYFDYLNEYYDEFDSVGKIYNVKEFTSLLYQIQFSVNSRKKEELKEFLDNIILSDNTNKIDNSNEDKLTLSTVHSVKGLEFRYVFIPALENGIFPMVSSIPYSTFDNDIEEERRIFYVAVTRAKEKLCLTSTQSRLLYGRTYENEMSQFIEEMLLNFKEDDFETIYESGALIKSEPKKNVKNDSVYEIGDIVMHTKFGEGKILSITDGIGKIFFKQEKAQKSILLSHHTLSKKED